MELPTDLSTRVNNLNVSIPKSAGGGGSAGKWSEKLWSGDRETTEAVEIAKGGFKLHLMKGRMTIQFFSNM